MTRLRVFAARVLGLFGMRWRDRDLHDEIEAHLDLLAAEHVRRGLSPTAARFAARREFGGLEQMKDTYRDTRGFTFLDTLRHDVRYALRTFRKSPGFVAAVLVSLSLGIGANTAIFEVVDALRLRSLPVSHPGQLVEIALARRDSSETRAGRSGNFSGRHPMFTWPQWERIRDRQQGFSDVIAWGANPFGLGTQTDTRFVQGVYVSGNFFSALGVLPAVGRLFTDHDDLPGCERTGVVLGYGFWQSEYGGMMSVLGQSILLDGRPFEIIGVGAESFRGVEVGHGFDVAVPLCVEAAVDDEGSGRNGPTHWWLGGMGRLKPDWTIAAASAQLATIAPGIFSETVAPGWLPEVVTAYKRLTLEAVPARTGISTGVREDYGASLWILLGTTAFILLIACANIANLLLARAAVRQREIAVRLAIGASRGQVIRQLLTENALLALLGASLAFGTARILGDGLVGLLKARTPTILTLDLALDTNWHVWAFTIAVAVATCFLFGLVPALRGTTIAPAEAMKSGGRLLTDMRSRFDLKKLLVVAQVALGLVLVVGAALFVRTFRNLTTADLGFQSHAVWDVLTDIEHARVSPMEGQAFTASIVQHLRALPGVEAAALVQEVPLSGNSSQGQIILDEQRLEGTMYFNRVGDGYFAAMRTPILLGRDFGGRDVSEAPRVAIVNEAFAKKFLRSGQSPIGHRLQRPASPGQPPPVYDIVGLVTDTKYANVREAFEPTVFFPYAQGRPALYFDVMVRADAAGGLLASTLNTAIGQFNPDVRSFTRRLDDEIFDTLIRDRLMAMLSGFFAVLAMMLATIGLYGVMSYVVSRRTGEVGIRMALGASRWSVLEMILGEAAKLVGVGLLLGGLASLALGRAATALLFGLTPQDPFTLVTSIAILASVAIAASAIPAARAAWLEPAIALRHE